MKIFNEEVDSENYMDKIIDIIFKRLLEEDNELDPGTGEQAPADNLQS